MRVKPGIAALLLLLAAACGPGQPEATPTPTAPALTGSVAILLPASGAIIYSEVLNVSGTANSLPNNQFTLQLENIDGDTVNQSVITVAENGNWEVELTHGYSGEPSEFTILALPTNGATSDDYDAASVVIAGNSYRPEGTFGSIISPADGSTIGGDSVEVTGTASGLFENEFVLALVDSNGNEVSRQNVTVYNPNFIDDMPWTAELATAGYLGSATIRAFAISARDGSEIPLDSVSVTVSDAAG